MDDYYAIPMTSDHKLGLGLSSLDVDGFHFPTSCAELGHDQLLALDDPQSFCLAFSDPDIFGTAEESISRTSTAVTPQSECSSRTNQSGRNISPSSDIMSFHDQPTPQDFESIIQDTTHSIISNRQSRAASVAWPPPGSDSIGLNGTLTPSRQFAHRPQSFSYRTPQMSQLESHTPPPSAYFASPNLQPVQQPSAAQSPFLSPNMQSPMLSGQNLYMQATSMSPSQSSYFLLPPQSQLPPHPQYQQTQQAQAQAFQLALQRSQISSQQQQQQQQQRRPLQANPNASMMQSFFSSQNQQQSSTFPPANNTSSSNTNHTTAIPNTTGNSTTGYQCFSHGCGGRHFSNWGNLVRHHRERQLRSKVGAKPTCARCGKGFTRSSARDAHVAGLKCVLGRRRRAATGGSAAAAGTDGDAKSDTADKQDDNSNADSDAGSPTGRKTRDSSEDAEAVDDEDDVHITGQANLSFSNRTMGRQTGSSHEEFDMAGLPGDIGPAYLPPQHLEFN